ncbi:carboxypeptidase B-like [Watersipora subatra]|uniref:carboxypeptidase B-like n=1 Tax=Watersipora subatra TaxID=2589382 RepID=UPI00355AEED8
MTQRRQLSLLGVKKNTAKPVVWLDSGIHAREWLSVSTTINIINKMLTQYKAKDSTVMDLLSTFDFYFIPVANPDGYVYSHTSGGRLWRKTRTRHVSGSIGVDPNRNWGYHWCVSGSSRSASSDSYCGPYAWSENCVYNMKQTLQNLGSRLKVFMTLHSYGQMWFVPYAWSRSAYPTDYNELVSLSISATSAMRKSTGASYRVGRVPDLLYEASGSSMDWVKGTLKTKYAFAMELRPSGNVANGFIAPVSDIAPTAEEVWEGFKVVVEKAKGNLLAG